MQPGWYRDPRGAPEMRWWDGERWTIYTMPLTQAQPKSGWGPGLIAFVLAPVILGVLTVVVVAVLVWLAILSAPPQ